MKHYYIDRQRYYRLVDDNGRTASITCRKYDGQVLGWRDAVEKELIAFRNLEVALEYFNSRGYN